MMATQAFSWVPNSGPLTVAMSDGSPFNALYLSKADIPIAFSAVPTPDNGNPFYSFVPIDSNPQTIPLPLGTTQVTLTGSGSSTYYVFANSTVYRLFFGVET